MFRVLCAVKIFYPFLKHLIYLWNLIWKLGTVQTNSFSIQFIGQLFLLFRISSKSFLIIQRTWNTSWQVSDCNFSKYCIFLFDCICGTRRDFILFMKCLFIKSSLEIKFFKRICIQFFTNNFWINFLVKNKQ